MASPRSGVWWPAVAPGATYDGELTRQGPSSGVVRVPSAFHVILKTMNSRLPTGVGVLTDPGVDPGADELLIALVRVAQAERRRRGFGIAGLTPDLTRPMAPRHLAALTQVVVHGPLSVSELAARLGVALTTTSLLVTQLAESGLVERSEDASDHRRTLASVRRSRSDEVIRLVNAHLHPLRCTLARLGPGRGATLLEGLGVLVEELSCGPIAGGSRAAAEEPAGDSPRERPGSAGSAR